MLPATASAARTRTSRPVVPATARGICTDVFVVSEDEPGQWRVADRLNDRVSGPFPDEETAVSVALDGVVLSRRWEIHVLDQFGILLTSYNCSEDAMHVKVV